MTGPEHYAEAERLLKGANTYVDLARDTADAENWPAYKAAQWAAEHVISLAQAHATLALAAATVEAGGLTESNTSGFDIPRYPSWVKAVRP